MKLFWPWKTASKINILQPTKNEDPHSRRIPAGICHIYQTACPPCLPDTTQRTHKATGRQGVRRRGGRPGHQNPTAASRGENGKGGPLIVRSPSHQAAQNQQQDFMGEPIAPHLTKRFKKINILELWRVWPLRE
jgi:hypothetical protein